MDEENVDKIRRRKLEEQKKANEAKKAQGQIKATLRIALDEKAYERIMNVKIVNEELFLATAQNIISAYSKLRRKITESELLYVLGAIKQQNEKKTQITFERK
ncbi:MAG: DNA-binding protein [Candidatus Micrarchaeota archaeon]